MLFTNKEIDTHTSLAFNIKIDYAERLEASLIAISMLKNNMHQHKNRLQRIEEICKLWRKEIDTL